MPRRSLFLLLFSVTLLSMFCGCNNRHAATFTWTYTAPPAATLPQLPDHVNLRGSPVRIESPKTRWSVDLGVPAAGLPLPRAALERIGSVVAASVGSGMVAVDLASGRPLWRYMDIGWPLLQSDAAFYARGRGGLVRLIPKTGHVAWVSAPCIKERDIIDIAQAAMPHTLLVLCSSPAQLVGVSTQSGQFEFRKTLLAQGTGQRIVDADGKVATIWAHEDGAMDPIVISVNSVTGDILGRYQNAGFAGTNSDNVYLFRTNCATCVPPTGGDLIRIGLSDGFSSAFRLLPPASTVNADVLDVVGAAQDAVYERFGVQPYPALYRAPLKTGRPQVLLRDVSEAEPLQNDLLIEVALSGKRFLLCRLDMRSGYARPISVFTMPTQLYYAGRGPHRELVAASVGAILIQFAKRDSVIRAPEGCTGAAYSLANQEALIICRGGKNNETAQLRFLQPRDYRNRSSVTTPLSAKERS